MSRPYKGLTIHEGYTDLGSFEINITAIENPTEHETGAVPVDFTKPRSLLFKLSFASDGSPVTPEYKLVFTAKGRVTDEDVQYTAHTNAQGFAQTDTPLFPVVARHGTEEPVIHFEVLGPLDERMEECYIQADSYYSLIKDFVISDSHLYLKDGDGVYYRIGGISPSTSHTAFHVTKTGEMYGYDPGTTSWSSIGTLTFTSFEHPENLIPGPDGFYTLSGLEGTTTTAYLGDASTPFESFYGVVNNPEPFLVDVHVELYNPGNATSTPDFSTDLYNLVQGSLNFIPVGVSSMPYTAPDTTPTLSDIETISGITFSTVFSDFLTTHGFTTLEKLRKAGPISYQAGFPGTVGAEELEVLQAHVDLYSLNTDTAQNQHLIDQGYTNIARIANTPKDQFLADVVGTDIALFRAAQIHEVAVQNYKLISNLVAGTLSSLRMANPGLPDVPGSTFRDVALGDATNACGCDDCKSMVSPFAYLMDLIKYAAAHVTYNTGGGAAEYTPTAVDAFVTLIEEKFKQPFGDFKVSCDTLHDEYCRVRLVTEVLETLVTGLTGIPATRLAAERNQYLTLVYQTILLQAGTSVAELRDVVSAHPLSEKLDAAQKLSDKLGIPLYVPSTTNLTVDKLWLTIGNPVTANQLTAANLEAIFGFRNTQRNVLTATPVSLMETWREAYLRDKWKAEDYLLTSYTREGVNPSNLSTFKSNWKPIIDPDIIGWDDFTYSPSEASQFAKELYKWRKDDTDEFLETQLGSNTTMRSVDLKNLILRVADRDISSHEIELNSYGNPEIQLDDTSTTFKTFEVVGKKLNGYNTDVVLSKPSITQLNTIFQPYGPAPIMRYNRVLVITGLPGTITTGTNYTISLPAGSIADYTGNAKLTSSAVSTVLVSGTNFSVTYSSASQIVLNFSTNPGSTFLSGIIKFIYEVEVPLVNENVPDPSKLSTAAISSIGYTYNLLSPVPSALPSAYSYFIWNTPTWPGLSASGDFGKLKELYQLISKGTASDDQLAIVSDDLQLSLADFTRMMDLMIQSEKHLDAVYTEPGLTEDEKYELASIFRKSAKAQLRDIWVKEEVIHEDSSSQPFRLQLSAEYFLKSMAEPLGGAFDGRLQTIPSATATSYDGYTAIIDPELVTEQELLSNPEIIANKNLWLWRQTELSGEYTTMLGLLIPYSVNGFENALKRVNNGGTGSYTSAIAPYANIGALILDLKGSDTIKQKAASDILWSAFRFTAADFLVVADIKEKYELSDPQLHPSDADLQKAAKLLLSAFKRKQMYENSSLYNPGWIEQEITGVFPMTPYYFSPVKYYNVLKPGFAPGRSVAEDRTEWQRTLEAWNRLPFIQPDIVPPENIVNFVSTNWVYTKWSSRKAALSSAFSTTLNGYINSGLAVSTLFSNFKKQLNLIVARDPGYTPYGGFALKYLPYFLEIADKEKDGEDIRPYIEHIGMTIPEYRFLAKVYKVMEDDDANSATSTSLLEEEFKDIKDIIIAIRSRYLPFSQVLEEYNQGIVLDQDYFRDYKPSPVNFPLTDIPVFNKWRSPHALRKAWLDRLDARIENEKTVVERWKEVLMEAEDRNMPLMRDALIRALMNECETFDEAAERLAKTYFIETKDNCCVKHTRISFAIETMQGFLDALQTGIYASFIADFSLSAPDFAEEWKWLGSYSSWRSAMFVFLYPENLLYPTLKRRQSPAFIELAEKLQNANKLSPGQACELGKQYQNYFNDIENINIICSTNARSVFNIPSDDTCCSDDTMAIKWMHFFFGQGPSGHSYWCAKEDSPTFIDNVGFWKELPVRTDAKLLGCFPLGKRGGPMWGPVELALYLFYSYTEDSKFKVAYIKKDLLDPTSIWSDEVDTGDLPLDSAKQPPQYITACQQGLDWESACFIFTYPANSGSMAVTYSHIDDKYTVWFENGTTTPFSPSMSSARKPITTIRHLIKDASNTVRNVLTYVWDDVVIVKNFIGSNGQEDFAGFLTNSVMGAYESAQPNTVIVLHKPYPAANTCATKLTISCSASGAITVTPTNLTTPFLPNELDVFYPEFREKDAQRLFAAKGYGGKTLFGLNALDSSTAFDMDGRFSITPDKVPYVPIQSADCITNMSQRKADLKTKLLENLNAPSGSSVSEITRSSTSTELLYEAYLHVPLLLALDQQKRGQYDSSLSWYRTIYDYTIPLVAKRKIFHGLVIEENNLNTFTTAPNWLLDPLNPHLIAATRKNAYTQYVVMSIIQCLYAFADREFTLDTSESVPVARRLYSTALELSKTDELNVSNDTCLTKAGGCLPELPEDVGSEASSWRGMLSQVRESLGTLGDSELTDSLAHDISDLLEAASEDDYPATFATAFEMIEAARPAPGTPDSISEVFTGQADRISNAARYLFAVNNTSGFNTYVSDSYANAVAAISGIAIEDISSPDSEARLGWLSLSVPANNADYQFQFASGSGEQNFSGERSFNPLVPTSNSYIANLNYTNANRVIGSHLGGISPLYTPLLDFVFCMPSNPVYSALILKGNLELFKIHNCRNIAGMIRELDPYPAPTDSSSGVPVIGASGNLALPGVNNFSPTQYRFRVLLERAKQITQQAQQLESLFLAALEKEDAENYAQLRAKQDLETAKGTIKLQDLRIVQANSEKILADLQLDKVNFTRGHFEELLAAGLNSFEELSLTQIQLASLFSGLSAVSSILAAATAGGEGVKNGFSLVTSNLATSLSSISNVFSLLSSYNATLASFARRAEEWQFQADLAGYDISIANQQIKIAEDNIRIVTQEREIAVLNSDHAKDALEFLRNKFTNAELYNWMGNVLESAYSYMLNLATATARTAESQLYFERQEQAGPFILNDYWETPSSGFTGGTSSGQPDRRGLTGSARLMVDIQRLDQHAFETNKRKLQMTKVISLAQNFPSEFQTFRETGVMNFQLTNKLFDYDFPGHYLRLINGVKTTVVGLLPVYDGIKATLTAEPTSYTVIGGTTFQRIPIKRLEVDSVALTSPNNASGVFEMQPAQGELLNPFEGMGIESRWEFKMPQFTNRFDFANIADVLVTVEYTALDSFQYRYQVLQDLENTLSFNRGFSFRNNFPDQWYQLGEAQEGDNEFGVTIELKREFFPQGITDLKRTGDVVLHFVREDGFEDEITVDSFNVLNSSGFNGDTTNGTIHLSVSGDNPLLKLELKFENTQENRELFSESKIKDILLLVGCKADLKSYPL